MPRPTPPHAALCGCASPRPAMPCAVVPRPASPRPVLPRPSAPCTSPPPRLPAPWCPATPSDAYANLLRRELFGVDSDDTSPITPNRNIFMYKIEYPSPGSPAKNLFMQDGFGRTIVGEVSTPVKALRKAPKTSQKVLDASSLQDDLPKSCGLVVSEYVGNGVGNVCVSVECVQKQGDEIV